MTVKELINQLLDCPMDAQISVKKELDWNVYVNSDLKIAKANREDVVFTFDFPTEKFQIERKKY